MSEPKPTKAELLAKIERLGQHEPKLTEAQSLVYDWFNSGHETLDDLAGNVARMVAEAEQTARAEAWRIGHDEACPQGEFCSAHQPIEARRATP